MLRRSLIAALFVASGISAGADTPPAADTLRGELLYSTHCTFCHGDEVHKRNKSLVTDWTSLQSQVNRWQGNSGLGWRNEDIIEVARYLNALHYHYLAPI